MGENEFAPWPVALYGIVLFGAALAYYILSRALISLHGRDSALALALGRDFKGRVSLALYALAILLCPVNSWLACMPYVLVTIIWIIPDPRIERVVAHGTGVPPSH